MPEEAVITAAAPAASVAGEGTAAPTSIADSPTAVEEPISGSEPTETAQPEAGEETHKPGAESDADAAGEDGRLLPKSIRALKETDPAAYKAEKARFFEYREYKQTFPTVAEARRVKQTLELVGGEAGLHEMQTNISDFEKVAKQFMDGDPAFVTDLAEMDPIAFASHVGQFIEKLHEIDEPSFNREIAKRITSEHQAVGLRNDLAKTWQLIAAGDTDGAKKLLEKIAAWHDRVDAISKQEDDPRYKKLQEQLKTERTSKAEADKTEFVKSYHAETERGIEATARKLYKSFTGREPEPEDLLILGRNADELVTKSEQFKEYREQRDILFQRRDKAALVRHGNAAYERALQMAMQKLMRGFGRGAAQQKPAAPNGTKPAAKPAVAPQGFTNVNARPKPSEIDYSSGRTTPGMIMKRTAILKDGRKVSWAHLVN